MKTVSIVVGDHGDISVGINSNSWELRLPIEDCLDNSFSTDAIKDLKSSNRLREIIKDVRDMYSVFNAFPSSYIDIYVDDKHINNYEKEKAA